LITSNEKAQHHLSTNFLVKNLVPLIFFKTLINVALFTPFVGKKKKKALKCFIWLEQFRDIQLKFIYFGMFDKLIAESMLIH
jgi:hypothetical protein